MLRLRADGDILGLSGHDVVPQRSVNDHLEPRDSGTVGMPLPSVIGARNWRPCDQQVLEEPNTGSSWYGQTAGCSECEADGSVRGVP